MIWAGCVGPISGLGGVFIIRRGEGLMAHKKDGAPASSVFHFHKSSSFVGPKNFQVGGPVVVGIKALRL